MDRLTNAQLSALQNLARKRDGASVPFVNISDARVLTELGYAERTREGWQITAEGDALLARNGPGPQGVTSDNPEPDAVNDANPTNP